MVEAPSVVDRAVIADLNPGASRVGNYTFGLATLREVAEVAIAIATHRAQSTVHELLKRIHAKLGISRRAELAERRPEVAQQDERANRPSGSTPNRTTELHRLV